MTTDVTQHNNDNTDGVIMALDYAAPSQIHTRCPEKIATLADNQSTNHAQHVALFAQLNRPAVHFQRRIKNPLVFRDSLLALFEVVSSDYRYVPKDRSAYSVFMQMRRSSRHKNLFTAQRDYYHWLFDNDPLAFCILDPIIQVHQGGVSFEVFSRDEGCYAQLTLTSDLFESAETDAAETILGTTSIDYSRALFDGIAHIRDYQQTQLHIGHDAVNLQLRQNSDSQNTDTQTEIPAVTKHIIEKRINVPKSWIRALLQVQAAAQLPQDTLHLDPIALYNVLFELRMHADIKGKRRGLLIELRPQQLPVMVLEPFNITVSSQISAQQTPYQGSKAKLIRLWGRRRLSVLKRLLPHTDSVSVAILGNGMPSYWTLTGKGFHFTFAMTGFSQANWSQALNFDLLLPKRAAQALDLDGNNSDLKHLTEQLLKNPSTVEALQRQDKKIADAQQIHQLLLTATQQGLIRYDSAHQRYYYRPLTQNPLDMAQFLYHNLAEKQAFDIISRQNSIQNLAVKTVATKGVSISADIEVTEDKRHYHSQLQLDDDGLVSRAECSCPQYLQQRLTQGVCAHLIALRLAYYDYDHNPANNNSEYHTCILSKRVTTPQNQRLMPKKSAPHNLSEAVTLNLSALAQPEATSSQPRKVHNHSNMAYIYLTLAHKKITIEQTLDEHSTLQQFVFNQPAQAQADFLQHIARFEAKGFIKNQGI